MFYHSIGLALAPWGVVGSGKFRTEAESKRRAEQGDHGRKVITSTDYVQTEAEKNISAALEKVANEVGTKSITAGTLTLTQDRR